MTNSPPLFVCIWCICVQVRVCRSGVKQGCCAPRTVYFFFFLTQVILLIWNLPVQSRLTSQWCPGLCLSPSPQHWEHKCMAQHSALYVDAGDQTQVPMLAKQVVYQLSLIPRSYSQNLFFKICFIIIYIFPVCMCVYYIRAYPQKSEGGFWVP